MNKAIGIVLVVCSLAAVGMAVLAQMAAAPVAEFFLREGSEVVAVTRAVDAARLEKACAEMGLTYPGKDPNEIARWWARAQHAQVVRRMTAPHVYAWGVAAGVMLACGVGLLAGGRPRAGPAR